MFLTRVVVDIRGITISGPWDGYVFAPQYIFQTTHGTMKCGLLPLNLLSRHPWGEGATDAGCREGNCLMRVMAGCRAQHTVAFTPTRVISWGGNSEGQCGHGERAERVWVPPRDIKRLLRAHVVQVACGYNHTVCVTATSQVGTALLHCPTLNSQGPALLTAPLRIF
jgi:Regulator of chromosome condensation (RCC1) repeat